MAQITRRSDSQRIRRALERAGSKSLDVGWFRDARHAPSETPIAYIAAIHEYGWGVPARPFIRPAQQEHGQAWQSGLARGLIQRIAAGQPVDSVFTIIGELITSDIRRAISAVTSPPLAEATIEARRKRTKSGNASDKPLIDTQQLIRSVTYKVTDT